MGGYELGLDPDASPDDGPTTYLGVKDIEEAVANLKEAGAEPYKPIRLVGEGIQVATMKTPEGYLLGLIENPHFQAAAQNPAAEDKPHF